MSFTFDDERAYDRQQEAIEEAKKESFREVFAAILPYERTPEELLAEIAAKDARIAELEAALQSLVEQVDTLDDYGHPELQMPLRANCPKCTVAPYTPVMVCPYHEAKACIGR